MSEKRDECREEYPAGNCVLDAGHGGKCFVPYQRPVGQMDPYRMSPAALAAEVSSLRSALAAKERELAEEQKKRKFHEEWCENATYARDADVFLRLLGRKAEANPDLAPLVTDIADMLSGAIAERDALKAALTQARHYWDAASDEVSELTEKLDQARDTALQWKQEAADERTRRESIESALTQAREELDREGAWMLERITGTLRAYPNNGGDIGVMREVERIVREATATLQAAHDEKARLLEAALTLWRRLAYFHSDVWREPMVYAATQKLAAAGLLGEKETGEGTR